MFRDREFKIEQNFLAGPISNTYAKFIQVYMIYTFLFI